MDDLRLLKVLREVALRGSFSAAAESLSYSQPAVSQQIARLEAQTGVKLIERQPKGIKLTPAGEALVRHTEQILAQLAHAQAELTEIASDARGKLRLASFATAAGTIVPRAVSAFRHLRPGVQVDLSLMDPPQSIPALRRGEVDLVITEEGGFEIRHHARGPRSRAADGRRPFRVAARRAPARHPARDRLDGPVRRGVVPGRPARHLRRLQHRAARLPGRGLRAARGLHVGRLLRDPGAGGERDGRRSGARAGAGVDARRRRRAAACAAARPTGGSARCSSPIRWARSR